MNVLHSLPRAGLVLTIAIAMSACSSHDENSPAYKRRHEFKQLLRESEALHAVAHGDKPYDKKKFLDQIAKVRQQATRPFPLLVPPKPDDKEKTRARPEIWSQPAEFAKAKAKFDSALTDLATAAQSGKLEVVQPAVHRLEESCTACHHSFREGSD